MTSSIDRAAIGHGKAAKEDVSCSVCASTQGLAATRRRRDGNVDRLRRRWREGVQGEIIYRETVKCSDASGERQLRPWSVSAPSQMQ